MRSLIFLLRSERVAATSNYRQKTCLHLHLCLNRIVSGTGRARTEPARQHLSLDDLNGFPSVTKKHPFSISLAFSSTAPRYNGFFFSFFTFSPSALALAHALFSVAERSEWVRKCEWEGKQTAFVLLCTLTVFVYGCACLTEFPCHCIVCMYGCFSNGWSTASVMKHSCISTRTSDYINSYTECSTTHSKVLFFWCHEYLRMNHSPACIMCA